MTANPDEIMRDLGERDESCEIIDSEFEHQSERQAEISEFREPSMFEMSSSLPINKIRPFPDPPLGICNFAKPQQLINISDEKWDEGTDSKRNAYTWIRD